MNGAGGHGHGDGNARAEDGVAGDGCAVGDEQDLGAVAHGFDGLGTDDVERGFKPDGRRIDAVQLFDDKIFRVRMNAFAQAGYLGKRKVGRAERDAGQGCIFIQHVRPGAKARVERDDDRLAERVDGGVGDLGEALAEVGVERARGLGEEGERGVVTHGPDAVLAFGGHGG